MSIIEDAKLISSVKPEKSVMPKGVAIAAKLLEAVEIIKRGKSRMLDTCECFGCQKYQKIAVAFLKSLEKK